MHMRLRCLGTWLILQSVSIGVAAEQTAAPNFGPTVAGLERAEQRRSPEFDYGSTSSVYAAPVGDAAAKFETPTLGGEPIEAVPDQAAAADVRETSKPPARRKSPWVSIQAVFRRNPGQASAEGNGSDDLTHGAASDDEVESTAEIRPASGLDDFRDQRRIGSVAKRQQDTTIEPFDAQTLPNVLPDANLRDIPNPMRSSLVQPPPTAQPVPLAPPSDAIVVPVPVPVPVPGDQPSTDRVPPPSDPIGEVVTPRSVLDAQPESPAPTPFFGISSPQMMPFGPLGLGGGCGYCASGCGGYCSHGGCGGAGTPPPPGAGKFGCGCGSAGCDGGCGAGGACAGGCGGEGCGGGCGAGGCGPRVRVTPDSCFLQRLACWIYEPYPDCSNGCVDFCHSFIFHEDCCWLFTNHKCRPSWCGPYPYGGCSDGACSGGNGCGCACTECVPPPDWFFTADALVLYRNNQSFDQTVVQLAGSGDPVLATDQFGFGWAAGPRFTLGYRPTRIDAWELSYFGLQDWNSIQTVVGAADLDLPGDLGLNPLLNFSNADSVNVSYSSTLQNAELNYFWQHRWLTWMIGCRYFQWSEDFDITSIAVGGTSQYDISTRNNLVGGQLGARVRGGWRRLNWDFTAKAGPYGNASRLQQTVGNVPGMTLRDTTDHESYWAFVGELGVNLNYYVTRTWSVRGGYNLLWAEGLALAPDQLDFTDTPTSGSRLQGDGGVFLHGAHLGLGCRW